MTVLRSRKLVTNPNEPLVVAEIEPITPDKQVQSMTNYNNNSETTPASSSHKLGLVASSGSGRVVRRSARLSLNSASYDLVDNVGGDKSSSSRKRKAPVTVKVENMEESDGSGLDAMDGVDNVVEKSSRKRKASVKLENNEDEEVNVTDGVQKESGGSGTDRVDKESGGSTSVEKSSKKRKAAAVAVKLENKEDDEVNVMDGFEKESGGSKTAVVSDVNVTEILTDVPSLNVEELVVQEEGDVVGSQSSNLPSGGSKVVLLPDLNQLAADEKLSPASKDGNEGNGDSSGRTTRTRRFTREDKNKGVSVVDVEREVVDVEREDMEIDLGKDIYIGYKGKGKVVEVDSSSSDSGSDDMDEDFVLGNATRIGLEDKGKEKVVEVDSSSHPHDPNEELDVGLMDDGIIGAADAGILDIERAGTSSSRMKEKFKNAAKKNAVRFAYFSHQQEEEDLDIDDDEEDEPEPPRAEANADWEDWPGPFSTAQKIINDRTANMPPQKEKKAESVPLIWVPKEKQQRIRRAPPSLQDLCMTIMSQHVDAITSLDSVPDGLRHKLTRLLCDSRNMNHHFFELLASGTPTEIRVRDCSWLTEEQFTKTFDKIDASNLTVLQLDQCGRCLPDYVLLPILDFLPSRLSALTNISLKGACRLSDAGLKALVDSARALRSINLGCCSLLTVDAINNLADKLGPVLKELYIDECFDLDAKHILPALLKLEQLEVLSVAHNESVDNSFITKFVAARGQRMKELVLANCTKLTDKAVRAISKSCPGLCAIDLNNVCKLKDKSLAHLASGCPKIQILKFCRNTFSDEAVAGYLEACGAPLRELSLNHVNKVAHQTAISLAGHARNLESLDLSFCREMTNEALGLIADGCSSLKTLKLFGCTQITKVFTDGHSNEEVKIIGLSESQILKNIEAVELLPLRYSSA